MLLASFCVSQKTLPEGLERVETLYSTFDSEEVKKGPQQNCEES